MRRARTGLLCVCVLSLTRLAAAQTTPPAPAWHVSADVLNVLTRGNDVHVGDVFTESQRDGGTATNSTFDYGVTYDPIVTRMDNTIDVLIEAGWRGARWGVGARGWHVNTSGEAGDTASSPTPTATFSAVTGIRMWDHSDIPVINQFHPSGFSPVTYHAENGLEHLRIDIFAERNWISSPGLNVAMRVGLAHGRLDNTRAEGHGQTAHVTTVSAGATTVFDNIITLEGTSESTMHLTGPSFGISGAATHGRFRVDWLVSPAALIGTANLSGEWIDTDNITQVTTTATPQVTTTDRLRGTIPFELEQRTVVPVLDLQAKASYRVAGALRVGAGLFSSSWFGAPVAPMLSIPGNWTDVEGTGWREQTKDLSFIAYSVFAAWGF
jgi:hypothetical protein